MASRRRHHRAVAATAEAATPTAAAEAAEAAEPPVAAQLEPATQLVAELPDISSVVPVIPYVLIITRWGGARSALPRVAAVMTAGVAFSHTPAIS